MDFSWLKELADQTNEKELVKQDKEKEGLKMKKQVALATCPFVDKLHLLINTYVEEFNKHCKYDHLKVHCSRMQKRSRLGKPVEAAQEPPDEVAYFNFARKGWLFGICGKNGVVDFLEFPISENETGISLKLDELAVPPSRRLEALLDAEGKHVQWTMEGTVIDGPAIISVCKKYFSEFIQRTNE